MAKILWKGGTMLAPVPPALVTTGTMDAPNVCTVAWCGVLNTKPPMLSISLRPQRFSHELLLRSGEFVVCLPTVALVRAVDYCGVKSGRDEDKFAACGLAATPAFEVAPPHIAESPLCLECRVRQKTTLGTHDMFVADIVAVAVEEALVDATGKLDLARAQLLAHAHGEYFGLGKALGHFGFSVRKHKKGRR